MIKQARNIMKKKFNVIRSHDTLQKACRVLIKNKISGVPVVNGQGQLVGFVSEKDIIRGLSSSGPKSRKVKDIMIKKVTSVKEDSSLELISKIFIDNPYGHIPVIAEGKAIGMISRSDVMDNLLCEYY